MMNAIICSEDSTVAIRAKENGRIKKVLRGSVRHDISDYMVLLFCRALFVLTDRTFTDFRVTAYDGTRISAHGMKLAIDRVDLVWDGRRHVSVPHFVGQERIFAERAREIAAVFLALAARLKETAARRAALLALAAACARRYVDPLGSLGCREHVPADEIAIRADLARHDSALAHVPHPRASVAGAAPLVCLSNAQSAT